MPPNIKASFGSLEVDNVVLDMVDIGQNTNNVNQTGLERENRDFFIPDSIDAEDEEIKEREKNHDAHELEERKKEYIKRMSSMVKDPTELSVDENRVAMATREAGEYAFGIVAVSVWNWDPSDNHLIMAKGGWWRSSYMKNSEALRQLENVYDPDYMQAEPIPPGVDLPGTLWASTSALSHEPSSRQHGSIGSLIGLLGRSKGGSVSSLPALLSSSSSSLKWRDLYSLGEDPDTAKKGKRLDLLQRAGFGLAAGIPFNINGTEGIVVYLARKNAKINMLSTLANQEYLRNATSMIGAAIAMSEARRASVTAKKHTVAVACRKFRSNLLVSHRDQEGETTTTEFTRKPSGVAVVKSRVSSLAHNLCRNIKKKFGIYRKKFRGNNMQAPPPMTLHQSLWTIIGSFCGLLSLSSLNEYYKLVSDDDYLLLIGPFGALMTLQYGLSAAPASQPRNAICGQAVSGAISLVFTYIPESIISVWLRRALGPAFAIGAMVFLGVTHPPAGAHAVIYASGDYNWAFYALVVFSSAVSIVPAMLVNNLSSKRTYPTYWGFNICKFPKMEKV